MPQSDHVASPTESIQSLPAAASPLRMPKPRHPGLDAISRSSSTNDLPSRPLPSLSQSEFSLPMRRSTPSAASLYAATLTPPGSRSLSPVGRTGSPRTLSLTSATLAPAALRTSSSSSSSGSGGALTRSLLETPAASQPGDPLHLLLHAFVPHVAIYSSRDTDALAREKGFAGGLWALLRPFGEHVPGKVTVRDSNGAARVWDDFSVRFVPFGDNIETPEAARGGIRDEGDPVAPETATTTPATAAATGRIPLAEAVVNQHLRYAERAFLGLPTQTPPATGAGERDAEHTSPYYSLYLRRLLSGLPVASHETFAHPVACVIAISSRNTEPIGTFRELYRDISQGERRLPGWVDGDFLRYYVLVHDEENGDIVQSMALFEKMKRSLGLHCHLLRLRSAAAVETDDDSVALPRSDWMTSAEELAELAAAETDDGALADPTRYLFESDATAIRTFVREMVTQSVVPTMERSVALWNDQWASKRRGLSGRFMSLSKRWAGFGGNNSAVNNRSSGSGGSSSYDAARGCYLADSPEAVLRKLADYAFMLRDWKLAMSTYDLLRADYTNDKAWRHHAAANEMAALALLIMPPALSSRTKPESIRAMLEQAFYSYHTRCASPYGALRTLLLALELQRLRAGPAVDDAVRWGMRLLDAQLQGPVGDALLRERMAVCCAARAGPAPPALALGRWRRKSAFWSVLAADTWVAQARYIQAQRCLNDARQAYAALPSGNDDGDDDGDAGIAAWAHARAFMAGLQLQLQRGLTVPDYYPLEVDPDAADPAAAVVVPDEEQLLLVETDPAKAARRRSRRDSLLVGITTTTTAAAAAAISVQAESAPLHPLSEDDGDSSGPAAKARPDSGFGQV